LSLKFNTLALSVFCVAYGVVVRCGTSPALKVRLVYSPLVPIGSLCQWKIPDSKTEKNNEVVSIRA